MRTHGHKEHRQKYHRNRNAEIAAQYIEIELREQGDRRADQRAAPHRMKFQGPPQEAAVHLFGALRLPYFSLSLHRDSPFLSLNSIAFYAILLTPKRFALSVFFGGLL